MPVNIEEGASPAEPPIGEDFLQPFGMSEGQHSQPIHYTTDSAASAEAPSAPPPRPQSAPAGPPSGSQSAGSTPGQRLVLSNGSAVQWKAPRWWEVIGSVKSVLARVVTTVVAVAWVAILVGVFLWLCRFVIGFIALQLLPSVVGSVGFA